MESFREWHWAILILVAFISGWIVAKRKNKKTRRQLRFSSDYFQGLNYLLNDEQDKAIEIFLRLVESDWQTIEIPFSSMYPAFRGRRLNTKNYPGEQMEMIAFLIGNKKAESFNLEIDKIELK